MYLKLSQARRDSGQGMVLMVMAMTIIATGVSMVALEHSRKAQKEAVEFKHSSDIMNSLNGVAKYLQQIYYTEANCDPYIFNMRLNSISNRLYKSTFRSQHLVDSGGAGSSSFNVSLGQLSPQPPSSQTYLPPVGSGVTAIPNQYAVTGFGPQDVSVTFWVVPYGKLGDQGYTKYEQTITLINTCSPQAPQDETLSPPRMTFNKITDATTYTTTVVSDIGTSSANAYCVSGGRARGSVDSNDTTVDIQDRDAYLNYVRSGVTLGVDTTCSDLNYDGIVNEVDLNIFDKTLKGYLYFSVPSSQQ